jgi:hypothetical protein
VDVTAIEAMQAAADTKSPAAKDEAVKFLKEILANGPVLKTEILEAAEADVYSRWPTSLPGHLAAQCWPPRRTAI